MLEGLLVFLLGVLSMVINRVHLLNVLLSFEMMMLGGFMMFVSSHLFLSFNMMMYLTLAVSEASLGLGVLVSVVYFYGNEHYYSFSLLGC